MATISTADFKNGMCILIDGKLNVIIDFQHVKPGKGGAFVRTKTRDVRTGRVVERTYRSGEKFENVLLTTTNMEYLYNDGTSYVFMDPESYEQINVDPTILGDKSKWLKENDVCTLMYAGDELIQVDPPMFVELEVTQTEPGFKGNTVQGGTKPATLETGATVNVPMFVNIGDKLKIDTRDGSYVTRV
ncbi:MAG: elongation factor P [Coriobacteriales bacterium]|nr:elongation factor P [Coriobacteriales bacterium]